MHQVLLKNNNIVVCYTFTVVSMIQKKSSPNVVRCICTSLSRFPVILSGPTIVDDQLANSLLRLGEQHSPSFKKQIHQLEWILRSKHVSRTKKHLPFCQWVWVKTLLPNSISYENSGSKVLTSPVFTGKPTSVILW